MSPLSSDDPGAALPPRGWYPQNRRVLLRLLAQLSQNPAAAPLVALDWDNTCIFHDIGDATFRYQLDHLCLRLTPAALAELLPDCLAGVTVLKGDVRLRDLSADLQVAYRALWPQIRAGQAAATWGSAAHQDFVAKLGFAYEAIDQTPGLGSAVSYPWLLRLFAGFADAEVEAMAQAAWQQAQAEPIGHGHIPSASAGAAGKCSFHFVTHVRLHPEMADLAAALQARGARVVVVTASYEPVVRGVAKLLGVAHSQVLGMRQPHPGSTYPLTYRGGKVAAIDQCLGEAPLLVAGDTNTDVEMLTHYPSTAVRLIVQREVEGPIRALQQRALTPSTPADRSFLLQGRDETQGCFWPSQRSKVAGPAP